MKKKNSEYIKMLSDLRITLISSNYEINNELV